MTVRQQTPHARLSRAAWLTLILALAQGSCNEHESRLAGPGEIGADCTQQADCASGLCLSEAGFAENYCSASCAEQSACPEGSSCHDYQGEHLCLQACSGATDCRAGYVCNYGVCRPRCTGARTCQEGDTCVDGSCQSKCLEDNGCAGTARCQDGKCVPPCTRDADCLPGNHCLVATGRCTPKPGTPFGLPCRTSAECATAYCLPTRGICSVRCSGSEDCPSSSVCGLESFDGDADGQAESAVAACLPARGPLVAGRLCTQGAECASGHCYDGFCMEGCTRDLDCGYLQCVQVNVVLGVHTAPYRGCLPQMGVASFVLEQNPERGQIYGVDIPPTATGFMLTAQVEASDEVTALLELIDPDGRRLVENATECTTYAQPVRYFYAEQISSLYVSSASPLTLVPGSYAYRVAESAASPPPPVTVRLHLKLGRAEKGTLNINWFFADLQDTCIGAPTLNAATAARHAWMLRLREGLAAAFRPAGLSLGKQSFHDLQESGLEVIDVDGPTPGALGRLLSSSRSMQGPALNVFVVRGLTSATDGGLVFGIAGGIPGPPGLHGTVHSGVVLSAQSACLDPLGERSIHALAHEIGHYLGLSHNLENTMVPGFIDGEVACPCPCASNMVCESDKGLAWCRGTDQLADTDSSPSNLMYFTSESTQGSDNNQLTASQIRLILDNPLVGH